MLLLFSFKKHGFCFGRNEWNEIRNYLLTNDVTACYAFKHKITNNCKEKHKVSKKFDDVIFYIAKNMIHKSLCTSSDSSPKYIVLREISRALADVIRRPRKTFRPKSVNQEIYNTVVNDI